MSQAKTARPFRELQLNITPKCQNEIDDRLHDARPTGASTMAVVHLHATISRYHRKGYLV
jgi:hypothetical protein